MLSRSFWRRQFNEDSAVIGRAVWVNGLPFTRRTREMGVRVALGATPTVVITMVLGFGMRLVSSGVIVGLSIAIALNILLSNVLSGFPPTDVLALAGAAVVFGIVGLLACYVPARRATQVDPVVVLRYE